MRARKHRPDKPFALMARDLDTVRRICLVTDATAALLESPIAPITILNVREDAQSWGLPLDLLTPDADTLGVMLPYTPLHALLFEPLPDDPTPPLDLLVMTSGNRQGEPIAISNGEALSRLAGIAERFLVHDREINLRNDDSLVAITGGTPQVWRRARGYAPETLRITPPLVRRVLAMGAELKNTIALGFGGEIVLSPHVGDLETPEALDGLEQAVAILPAYFRQEPEAVAVDLHPDMRSTRLGLRLAAKRGLPVVAVQHHHAHAASAMGENGLVEALALVMDGTGFGPDGTIWGAELLHVTPRGYTRLGTFAGVPLPGGDAAVLEPARQLVARWVAAGVPLTAARLAPLGVTEQEAELWALQCRQGLNAPTTHAAGRLFDAAAVVAGVAPQRVTYEGQAAIRLESAARRAAGRRSCRQIPVRAERKDALLVVDWAPLFADMASWPGLPEDVDAWAFEFHDAVARAGLALAIHGRESTGVTSVVLSGGVWMNRILTDLATEHIEGAGLRVFRHRLIPPNDGGIAFGQAIIAGRSELHVSCSSHAAGKNP